MSKKYYQTSNLIEETDIKAPTLRRYIRELINNGYPDTERDERGNRLFSELDRRVIIELVRLIQDEKKGVTAAIEEVTANVDDIKQRIEDEKEAQEVAESNIIGESNKEIIVLLHRVLDDNKRLHERIDTLTNELQGEKEDRQRLLTLLENQRTLDVKEDVEASSDRVHKDTKDDITAHVKDIHTDKDKAVVEGDNARTQDVIERNTDDVQATSDRVHDTYTNEQKDITDSVKSTEDVQTSLEEIHQEGVADPTETTSKEDEQETKKAGIFSRLMNVFK